LPPREPALSVAAPRVPDSILAMVVVLARLGLLGFGGVGPQAHSVFVERARWLGPHEFADALSLAQALPGANVVNLCAIVGDRWFGPSGALAAVCAITLPPLAIVLIAADALARVTHAPHFVTAECAVVAASAGLILATAYRVFATIVRRRALAVLIAAAVTTAVAAHALSLPVATLAGLAAGIGIDLLASMRR
jgi:chromate transporter